MDPSPVARSRGPLIAGALAGLALVLAAVTAVVVLGRDRGGASTGQVRLVEARTSATALAAAIAGTPLRLDGGRMLATDPAALGLAPGDLVRTIGGNAGRVGQRQVALVGQLLGGRDGQLARGGQLMVFERRFFQLCAFLFGGCHRGALNAG